MGCIVRGPYLAVMDILPKAFLQGKRSALKYLFLHPINSVLDSDNLEFQNTTT